MNCIKKYSEAVAANYSKDSNKALDPATIMVFVQIALTLIETFKECRKTNSEAAAIAQRPSLFQRIVVRNKVRQELGGRREFRELEGDKIVQSILEVGKTVTPQDMKEMYDEAESA